MAASSAMAKALSGALIDADLTPDDIDAISSSANGSLWLDRAEAIWITAQEKLDTATA